ncbi:putative pectinesterase/pectinesterase inhibitor 21-like [Trifolium medium]|uniref:Putative pectinesterase/pectinesterase inhibitor 21-like n=1 Tax=Trifolium medium TaxID=97028 RepID=A0A392PJ94_9FABA|nr:putative pectinesterase/pectinesterase inhibitor 21-like [Trifolium medium]
MESNIGGFIDPKGWLPWINGTNGPELYMDTCYYAEYANTGLGANLANRVHWKGYRGNISRDEAIQYTAAKWLEAGTESSPVSGTEWFKGLHVPHYLGFKA